MSTAVLDRRPVAASARRSPAPLATARRAPVARSVARRRPTHAVYVLRRLATFLALIVVISGVVWTLSATESDASLDAGTVAASVVVAPGETVWDIAQEYLPEGQNAHAYVARVLTYNGIDAAAVAPGTVLQLPRS